MDMVRYVIALIAVACALGALWMSYDAWRDTRELLRAARAEQVVRAAERHPAGKGSRDPSRYPTTGSAEFDREPPHHPVTWRVEDWGAFVWSDSYVIGCILCGASVAELVLPCTWGAHATTAKLGKPPTDPTPHCAICGQTAINLAEIPCRTGARHE